MGFSCEELLILPDLFERIQDRAPAIRFMARRAGVAEIADELDGGRLDIAVGCYPPAISRYGHMKLFEASRLLLQSSAYKLVGRYRLRWILIRASCVRSTTR
jgi:LysR substrate binding domain